MLMRAALQGLVVGDLAYTLTGHRADRAVYLLVTSAGWVFSLNAVVQLVKEVQPMIMPVETVTVESHSPEDRVPEAVAAVMPEPVLRMVLAGLTGAPTGPINVVAANLLAAGLTHTPMANAANSSILEQLQSSLSTEMVVTVFCSSAAGSLGLGFVRQLDIGTTLRSAAIIGVVGVGTRVALIGLFRFFMQTRKS